MDADDQLTSLLSQIDSIFPPSPDLHIILTSKFEAFIAESEPHEDGPRVCEDTITFVQKCLSTMRPRELDAILKANPRLDSSQFSDDERESLDKLNAEYEKTFSGLRYVVFVNGQSDDAIKNDLRIRISRNDINQERRKNVQAMCDIARDRLKSLFPV